MAWGLSYSLCRRRDPQPITLRWLLEHGGDPKCGSEAIWKSRGIPHPGTALDYLLGADVRDPEVVATCIEILPRVGGKSKHAPPAVGGDSSGSMTQTLPTTVLYY
jgi:hypothetical protein